MGWWARVLELLGITPAPSATPAGAPPLWPWIGLGGAGNPQLYVRMYRTQPHVRTVVDFLASQLGQLGIQVFRRVSDTDRVRVTDHPLAKLLTLPNPSTPRYRFIRDLVMDYGIFGNGYAVKSRARNRLALYRVPPSQMAVDGDLVPRVYTWTLPNGGVLPLLPSEVLHIREYDPESPVVGLSPIETLCRLLLEEQAATDYRAYFWKNAARLGGTIQRPKDAPRWTSDQREEFRKDWRRYFTGPRNAGRTAVLEDGMTFEPNTATAQQSQLIETRKLTREEVAAAYHVPPAMIGIVESQGYGSIREQHSALYQDTLGPSVAMLEGELLNQLGNEFSDLEGVYLQFNINEKMQGSFDEESSALMTAVGSPWMTRNEARARMNLPAVPDPDFNKPVTRLDIAEGQNARTAAGG
jgi:HK97 family phage portal protein